MIDLPTIVLKFGDGVDSTEFFLPELDDTLNRNLSVQGKVFHNYWFLGVQYFVVLTSTGFKHVEAGDIKTQFNPGDKAYFLMNYDFNKLKVSVVIPTAGTVVVGSIVQRTVTDRILFDDPDSSKELSHIPTGVVTPTWYGRASNLDVNGRTVKAASVPAICDLSYPYRALSAHYIPPPMSLAEGQSYPVAIVIHVDLL